MSATKIYVCTLFYLPGLTWETIQSSYVSAVSVVNEAFAWWLIPSFFERIPFRESRIWKKILKIPKNLIEFSMMIWRVRKNNWCLLFCVGMCTQRMIQLIWTWLTHRYGDTHMCTIVCLKQCKSMYFILLY